jgi:hypothetical protein
MTEELVLCPFCGSSNIKSVADGDGRSWQECQECFATGPAGSKYDGEEGEPFVKPRWETRPLETAAYIRGLRRAVEIVEAAQKRQDPFTNHYRLGMSYIIDAINYQIDHPEAEIKEAQS